jgi:hypothetical protein
MRSWAANQAVISQYASRLPDCVKLTITRSGGRQPKSKEIIFSE